MNTPMTSMSTHRAPKLLALATCLGATFLASSPAAADTLPDPPAATISSPMDGAMFEGAPAIIAVELAVTSADLIDSIDLYVDGEATMQDVDAPFGFTDVELGEGMHSLYVTVTSEGAVAFTSPTVNVAVIADAGETGGTAGTDGGTTNGGGDTNSGGGDSSDESGSCSCSSANAGLGGLLGLGFMGLAVFATTRRRED
jgi:MYXO-CTERM domain-containing protein